MKKAVIIGVVAIIALLGARWWSNSLSSSDSTIISRNGIHWHPELEIYVKGEKVDIPQNVGLAAVHNPIHTHEDLPIIHLEFEGLVRKDDIRLGQFFRIWNKDFMSFGSTIKMTVNGQQNTELENYLMQDKDKIKLEYE